MSKNNKRRKKDQQQGAKELENQNELLNALDDFIKQNETEIKQQEKESEESKRLKKKLNEKLSEVEKLKAQENHNEIYELLVKTVSNISQALPKIA